MERNKCCHATCGVAALFLEGCFGGAFGLFGRSQNWQDKVNMSLENWLFAYEKAEMVQSPKLSPRTQSHSKLLPPFHQEPPGARSESSRSKLNEVCYVILFLFYWRMSIVLKRRPLIQTDPQHFAKAGLKSRQCLFHHRHLVIPRFAQDLRSHTKPNRCESAPAIEELNSTAFFVRALPM